MRSSLDGDATGVSAAGIGARGQDRDHADLTVSVFLQGGFVDKTASRTGAEGALAASVEGCVRSLYPGASISVRVAELLDSDWEVQIGELGRGRMGGADRVVIEKHLRLVVGAAISRLCGTT